MLLGKRILEQFPLPHVLLTVSCRIVHLNQSLPNLEVEVIPIDGKLWDGIIPGSNEEIVKISLTIPDPRTLCSESQRLSGHCSTNPATPPSFIRLTLC